MEGSKSISVTVTSAKVLERVQDQVYYLGESIKSNPALVELGAKIQASSDEDPILNDFISDSVSIVNNLLSRTIGLTTYTNNKTTISFTSKATKNTPDLQTQLQDYVLNYISTYVMEQWLSVVKSDEAARFGQVRERLEHEIVLLAAQRSKPTRSPEVA